MVNLYLLELYGLHFLELGRITQVILATVEPCNRHILAYLGFQIITVACTLVAIP